MNAVHHGCAQQIRRNITIWDDNKQSHRSSRIHRKYYYCAKFSSVSIVQTARIWWRFLHCNQMFVLSGILLTFKSNCHWHFEWNHRKKIVTYVGEIGFIHSFLYLKIKNVSIKICLFVCELGMMHQRNVWCVMLFEVGIKCRCRSMFEVFPGHRLRALWWDVSGQ